MLHEDCIYRTAVHVFIIKVELSMRDECRPLHVDLLLSSGGQLLFEKELSKHSGIEHHNTLWAYKFFLNISNLLKYLVLRILCVRVSFCKSSPTNNYTNAEEQCVETQYHNLRWFSKIITL